MATIGHENEIITVEGLKSSLQKMKTDIIDEKATKEDLQQELFALLPLIDGHYWNYTSHVSVSSSTYTYNTETSCQEGDIFIITGQGGDGKSRLWVFVDAEGENISVAEALETRENYQLTAPEGAVSFYFTAKISSNPSVYKRTLTGLIPRVTTLESNVERIEDNLGQLIYNPKVDLKKSNLKILDIGNSYTADSTHYLSNIISAANITDTNYSHYIVYTSSGSFKKWVQIYKDEISNNIACEKVSGATISGIEGTGTGSLLRTILDTKWDIILIHQVSSYANKFNLWESHKAGGYLKELVRILKNTNPNASIGTVIIHSYRSSYSSNIEKSSLVRWKKIANATKQFAVKYGIDFILPYGTAVQNLRATSLCDTNEFSTDGTHLADGIGDYVASCCYFQALYAPRFGKTIIGNTWRKTDLNESTDGVKNINNANAELAQKAAFMACCDMYNINNPDEVALW